MVFIWQVCTVYGKIQGTSTFSEAPTEYFGVIISKLVLEFEKF